MPYDEQELSIGKLEAAYESATVEFDEGDGSGLIGGTAYYSVSKHWESGINDDIGEEEGWCVDVELIALNNNGWIIPASQIAKGFKDHIQGWEDRRAEEIRVELEHSF